MVLLQRNTITDGKWSHHRHALRLHQIALRPVNSIAPTNCKVDLIPQRLRGSSGSMLEIPRI
jgi:hypothetical protein